MSAPVPSLGQTGPHLVHKHSATFLSQVFPWLILCTLSWLHYYA